ncbi:MAG: hypothetical protein ABFS17_07325 [Chloroflexota bacterium]
MNVYYTAKDIEELAAKGVLQIELGPGGTLTDFAQETAQQLGVELVKGEMQVLPSGRPNSTSIATSLSDKYNKPKGCLHTSDSIPITRSQAAVPSGQSIAGTGSDTVNKLIDLMGKVIRRGG